MGWRFEGVLGNLSFCSHYGENWERSHSLVYLGSHSNDQFFRFHHFCLGYHILIFSSTCVNIRLIQSQSTLSQRCSAPNTQCFRANKINSQQRWFRADFLWNNAVRRWIFQFWTTLIYIRSELIGSETVLISADYPGMFRDELSIIHNILRI